MDFGARLRFILLFVLETASCRRGKQHDPILNFAPYGVSPIPILSRECKSALVSDLPLIATALLNLRIRLPESWPLRIDTAGTP